MAAAASDMRGRVALVTGASGGIGLALARGLAERGATVLMVSRAGGAGAAEAEALRRRSGNPEHRFLPADLSAQAEVRRLAAEVAASVPRLDVLVNNAGAMFHRRQLSPDGIEMTWALDHLASVLLTLRLLGPLAAAGGRIVTTTSLMAYWGWLHRDPGLKRGYNPVLAYAQARLANVLFTVELARRLPPGSVTAHAFDPGIVRTALGQGPGFWNLCIRLSMAGFGRTAASAAATVIELASGAAAPGSSGAVWKDGRRRALPRAARDPRNLERLWRLSLAMIDAGEDELGPLRRLEDARPGSGARPAADPQSAAGAQSGYDPPSGSGAQPSGAEPSAARQPAAGEQHGASDRGR